MVAGLRKALKWFFYASGASFVLAGLFGPSSSSGAHDAGIGVVVLGALFIFIGTRLRGEKQGRNNPLGSGVHAPTENVATGKPGEYTTKRCPACCETIPLAAQFCEHCGKKQREGDSTCSGNEDLTAAQARSFFAGERANAKKIGSTQYIWRSCKDGARCERCANNDGHVFSWDEEPQGGHAGAKARCRCYPEAIIPKSR